MSWTPENIYIALGLLALLLIGAFKLDTDTGGYKDYLLTPDKAEHFGISLLLVLGSVWLLHVQPWPALVITVSLGFGYEVVQAINGRRKPAQWLPYMWRDLLADTCGALLGYLITRA